MKKILIFGVCGNTGKYLLDYFLNSELVDFEIIGIDMITCDYVEKNARFIQMNINNKNEFDNLPSEDIFAVIDLIGPMPARMEGYNPEEYVRTNIMGTFNVVQFCVEKKVDRFIYAKSFSDILSRSEKDITLTVDMSPSFDYGNQHSIYTVSQLAAVELIKCIHSYYSLKTFIIRLPTIYLWSKNDKYFVKGKIAKKMYLHMIDCAIDGKDVEVWGDPERSKDMLYVKDLCQMIYKACFVNRNEGYYNAGTGVGTSLINQVQGIIDVFDQSGKSKLNFCPEKPNAPQYIMDIKESVDELGYCPKYSYLDMLRDMKIEGELNRF